MTRDRLLNAAVMLVTLLVLSVLVWSQAPQQGRTLTISGQPGEIPVAQINGRSYVDIEALARLMNGSLAFKGNQTTLTLPGAAASTPEAAPAASQPENPGFSKEFMKAGIEEMSVIREWRSALLNAVQNGYPVTDAFVAGYRGQAATSLRLASVAA